ncbi:MAG: Undecaprenyl-diphosphatase [Microgenomates group bacterium GW2011_GWC2_46_7]|nr:MAG: Undecaprenyl-diphosphatase [Microgenomates group bacterium GW2011_GWC2_46_7]
MLGISRERVVEFSFFLAIPTMIAASGLELVSAPSLFTSGNFMALGVGFLTSFIVAVGAIKLFMRFIQKHSFVPFGIYRILIALAFLYLL